MYVCVQIDRMHAVTRELVQSGYSATTVLSQLSDVLLRLDGMTDVQRAHALQALAHADKALIDGADEELQLMQVRGCRVMLSCVDVADFVF